MVYGLRTKSSDCGASIATEGSTLSFSDFLQDSVE